MAAESQINNTLKKLLLIIIKTITTTTTTTAPTVKTKVLSHTCTCGDTIDC